MPGGVFEQLILADEISIPGVMQLESGLAHDARARFFTLTADIVDSIGDHFRRPPGPRPCNSFGGLTVFAEYGLMEVLDHIGRVANDLLEFVPSARQHPSS